MISINSQSVHGPPRIDWLCFFSILRSFIDQRTLLSALGVARKMCDTFFEFVFDSY